MLCRNERDELVIQSGVRVRMKASFQRERGTGHAVEGRWRSPRQETSPGGRSGPVARGGPGPPRPACDRGHEPHAAHHAHQRSLYYYYDGDETRIARRSGDPSAGAGAGPAPPLPAVQASPDGEAGEGKARAAYQSSGLVSTEISLPGKPTWRTLDRRVLFPSILYTISGVPVRQQPSSFF